MRKLTEEKILGFLALKIQVRVDKDTVIITKFIVHCTGSEEYDSFF